MEHERGLTRKVNSGSRGKAAKYIVLTQTEVINNRVNNYDSLSCQTQKIRNPGRTYGTIGKRNGQIIDYVHSLGRTMGLEELAKHLGVRKNSLKARNLKLLVKLGLLEEVEGGFITPADIEDRLERELEESGQLEAERLQREKYERERRAWRGELPVKTTVSIPRKQEPEINEKLIRNIPKRSTDGIIHHKGECTCWLCQEDAPEYIPQELVIAA